MLPLLQLLPTRPPPLLLVSKPSTVAEACIHVCADGWRVHMLWRTNAWRREVLSLLHHAKGIGGLLCCITCICTRNTATFLGGTYKCKCVRSQAYRTVLAWGERLHTSVLSSFGVLCIRVLCACRRFIFFFVSNHYLCPLPRTQLFHLNSFFPPSDA